MGWSDKLLTGIEEIDEQHKALFEVINRLDLAVSSEDKWSAVHFALVELAKQHSDKVVASIFVTVVVVIIIMFFIIIVVIVVVVDAAAAPSLRI